MLLPAATTGRIENCQTCELECPKDRLADTDETYELRSVSRLKKAVDDALAALLNADGPVEAGCIGKVI